jgi:poly-beta-1,6-N-acetyl-D-glucosamine synthase
LDYLANIAPIFGSQMMLRDNPFLTILLVIFILSAITQLFYYLYYYLSPGIYKVPAVSMSKEPVSVIICARNEEENLKNFLPAIMEQDYPDFEVIVVNDCSDDDSYFVLGEYLKKYPNLHISNISKDPKFTHNKKFAQFIGIKAARNELMLFTDADCRPESNKWIENMVSHFNDKTDFVLGYGGFFKGKGLLNKYIRYDSMVIAMQYFGMAIRGIPYMGVGRNIAYRRSLFFRNKGFGSYNYLASGDDDLFVNSNASKANTALEFEKEAHTRSVPASNLKEFIKQKKRHMTTAKHYKGRDQAILIAEPASRILFYASFIILLSFLFLWPVVLAVFAFRLLIQLFVINMVQERFNEGGIMPWIVIFDVSSPFINSLIYIKSQRQHAGKYQWK